MKDIDVVNGAGKLEKVSYFSDNHELVYFTIFYLNFPFSKKRPKNLR